jgi:hypothetical protein
VAGGSAILRRSVVQENPSGCRHPPRSSRLFVWEVVKAHVARSPRYPRTLHYRGDGEFMLSGANTRRYRRLFKPEML